MAEAVHLALSKIGSVLVDEDTNAFITQLSEKVINLKELPTKVKVIMSILNIMNDVIIGISTAHLTNYVVKGWIEEVQGVAYRVEDALDRFSYHALQLKGKGWMKKTHYIRVFGEIAQELIRLERKTQNALNRKDRWLFTFQHNPHPLAGIDRERHQYPLQDVVKDDIDPVEIEDNTTLLTKWLHCAEPGCTVITVSGLGGMGKTTLVKNVYEREKNSFTTHSWIEVSHTYSATDLLRELLTKIGYQGQTELAECDAFDLSEKIKEILKDNICLIVLDDVWDPKAYTKIRHTFQNLQACRIIITTRFLQVAALAHQTRQLRLEPKTYNVAFKLFCRIAFSQLKDHKCPPEIEKLAEDIVSRCGGMPLAIQAAGQLFKRLPLTYHAWNERYKQFVGEVSENNSIQAILTLNYHGLPGYLKNCFLYCALFPEDHQYSRENLVLLWVAEGFAVGNEQNTAEQVAEMYLTELIEKRMLQVEEYDELGRVSTCRMHDLLHELAIYIAKEGKFGFGHDSWTTEHMDREIRRLSSCRWDGQTASQVKFPCLRTVVSLGITASSPQLLSSILSGSSYLTVLELQGSEITEVPDSIGNLFNLRYIGVQRTRVKSLPESIGKLSNLQTLNIRQTKIEKLPRGIVKVKKLRHLLVNKCAGDTESEFRYLIGVQAPKQLSNLEELHTLETIGASKDLPKELMKLMRLRSLCIDNIKAAHSANLFDTLSRMPLLSSLLLSASDEDEVLCFETLELMCLHKLIIRGKWARGTLECPIFYNHGRNLRYLDISWCHFQEEDPLQLLASCVPHLAYLSLNKVSSASTLVLSAWCFLELKTLVLKRMPDVNQLEIMIGAIPMIKCLYIMSLPKLDKVPQGIESLLSLEKLWLLDLHEDFKTQWHKAKISRIREVRV